MESRIVTHVRRADEAKSVSVEMIRAFVTLADTLNLSATAATLSTTRQTVKRHIDILSELKGGPLFELENRSYALTSRGLAALDEAHRLLEGFESWSDRSITNQRRSSYLEYSEFHDERGRHFASRQHPVSHVSGKGTKRIRECFAGWGAAAASIGSDGFDAVRKDVVLYRRGSGGWICVAVGETSAYAAWFGKEWAQSAIGRLVYEDNAGNQFNRFIFKAYERVYETGGIRYDHLRAHLPKPETEGLVEVTFQRLLLGCTFPDGAPALAVVVDISDEVDLQK